MDQLHKQVARARRRLVIEQFLGRLTWCLSATLLIALLAIAAPRLFVVTDLPANWDTLWLAGGAGAGLLAAVLWTVLAHRSPLDAAIEIDRRFALRERVASSLSLSPEDRTTDAGRAVVGDATRAIGRIDVDERFRVRLDRRAWWPLVPALAALVLVGLVDTRQASSGVDPNVLALERQQIRQATESARKKLEEQRKQAEQEGLRDAERLFDEIELGTREVAEKPDMDRTQAAVKLNDLAKQIQERQRQLGGQDGLQRQLQNMRNLGAGPADKAAQAMREGDWQKAREEIDRLAQQLREGQLDDAAREQLAKQLDEIREQLAAAANAHQQAVDELKQQIEQQRRAGNLAEAGELQQKLDQLQQQGEQMDRMQQLAQQLGQIQQGLEQGDAQQAADALAQMAEGLEAMQQEMNELELLDAALVQIEMAKNMMNCGQCQGGGCQACQNGQGNMGFDQFGGKQDQPSSGIGTGRGGGLRRDTDEPETNSRDSRVRQAPGRGPVVFGGTVDGPNVRGDVVQSIQQDMAGLGGQPAEALTLDRLPRTRREHAEEYFQVLRDGD